MMTYVNGRLRGELLAHGRALAQAGHLRAAALLLGLVADAEPDPGLTVGIAGLLLDAGDAAEARKRLETGARAHGLDSRTSYLRIIAAARTGDLDAATRFARDVSRDPDMGQRARLLLVDLLMASGDPRGAREEAVAALRDQPNSIENLTALARLAGLEGRKDEQLDLLERARSLDPENPSVRAAHGAALVEVGSRSEGQRELAAVLAERPRDRAAASALFRSSLPPRRFRWVLLAVYLLLPVIVAYAATVLWPGPPHPWFSSVWLISYLVVVLLARAADRLRTDPSVRAIKSDTRRRLVRRLPLFPTLRPLRWLLVATLSAFWGLMLLAAAVVGPASVAERVGMSLVSLPAVALSLVAMRLWRRRRRQLARGEPRRFDPSTCQCHLLERISGRRADAYVRRHLTFDRAIYGNAIERHRCEVLRVRWVWLSDETGFQGEALPAVLRLPLDFVPPADESSGEPAGFYL